MTSKGLISRSRLKMMMLVLVASAPAAALAAADQAEVTNLKDAFAQGQVDGYLRTTDYQTSNEQFNNGNGNIWAWGGELNFETAKLWGFSGKVGANFQRVVHVHGGDDNLVNSFGASGINGDLNYPADALGEAYIQYNQAVVGDQELTLRAGNVKLDDSIPFTGTYDYRIVPQIYQGATAKYGTDRNNVQALAIHRFKPRTDDKYHKKVERFGAGGPTNGFWAIGAQGGTDLDAVALDGNAWFFQYKDIAKLTYVDGQIKAANGQYKPFLGLQYADESDDGDKNAGKIDGDLFGVQLGLDAGSWQATLNYASIGGDTGLFTPYATGESSSLIYAQSYLNSVQDFGPLDAYSAEFVTFMVPNTVLGARYSIYDQDSSSKAAAAIPNNGYFGKQKEALLFGIYNFQGALSGLSVSNFIAWQTRDKNYPGDRDDYVENRLTLNYNF